MRSIEVDPGPAWPRRTRDAFLWPALALVVAALGMTTACTQKPHPANAAKTDAPSAKPAAPAKKANVPANAAAAPKASSVDSTCGRIIDLIGDEHFGEHSRYKTEDIEFQDCEDGLGASLHEAPAGYARLVKCVAAAHGYADFRRNCEKLYRKLKAG